MERRTRGPYVKTTNEERKQIVEAYLKGQHASTISVVLNKKRSTVESVIKTYLKEDRTEGKLRGGPRGKKLTDEHVAAMKTWIDEFLLALELKGVRRGVIIMDNVPFHKTSVVVEKIEATDFKLLFLPPYSPFLNPIENLFSKMKEIVRRSKPQTEEQLLQNITESTKEITAADCTGFFQNMKSYQHRCLLGEEILD